MRTREYEFAFQVFFKGRDINEGRRIGLNMEEVEMHLKRMRGTNNE